MYKRGDKKDPANYHPVSLTSICCKVMEHILCLNLSKHFDKHIIFSENQHWFWAKRSCETQLAQTIEDLTKALDENQQIGMAILDLSKAFDMSTQRTIFEIVSYFTAFGLKWILNNFKYNNNLYLLTDFILNLPARNAENTVPATLLKFASRIKHRYPEVLILYIVRKSIFFGLCYLYLIYTSASQWLYYALIQSFCKSTTF